jgi:hypothetical protein
MSIEAMKLALEALLEINELSKGENAICLPAEIDGAMDALRTAIAEAEKQEPYAYTYMGIKADGSQHGPHLCWRPEYMDAMSANKGAVAIPLYTTPFAAQRQPLTDEQIDAVCAPLGFAQISPREVARAIEAAHGIGEKK